MEEWLDINSFPNYQVSSYGRVRNKRNEYIIKPSSDRYGYLKVSLGSTNNVPVHRLVCETFHGSPNGSKNQVNHIDCDRQNNNVDNLEWCTGSENIRWGITNGCIDPMKGLRRASEVNSKPVRITELDKTFSSVKECAVFLGVPPTNVSRCLVGSRKGQKLHGYNIEFMEEANL